MDFIFLNDKMEQVYILDSYESLIWTDRYSEAGDFEIYTIIDLKLISLLNTEKELYLWSNISNHLMMVTGYNIKTGDDEGSKMLVTGKSVEFILNRRIVWNSVVLKDNLNNCIKKLIVDNAINPAISARKIPNLIYIDTKDERILSKQIEQKFFGDNLLDAIQTLCSENNVGFRLTLNSDNVFEASLYMGDDRSYDQLDNPYVVFSPEFENLGSSNYLYSKEDYKNVIGVMTGDSSTLVDYNPKNFSGMDRREITGEKKDIDKYKIEEAFEGQVDSSGLFHYGIDFNVGDIVQIRNEYGIEAPSRVSELVFNQTQDTYEVYPTFIKVDKEGNT